MTTDPNGWPDAARPGVPLNPERSGPHELWNLPHYGATGPTFWVWDAAVQCWTLGFYMKHPEEAAQAWRYVGPCLLPADVVARKAATAEAIRQAAKVAAMRARFGPPSMWQVPGRPAGWHMDRDCTPEEAAQHDNGCVDAMRAIAALDLPAPDALARALAEAEARIHDRYAPPPPDPLDAVLHEARCNSTADEIYARICAEAKREGMERAAAWHDAQAEYHYGMAAQLIADGRPSTAQRASENAEAHQRHAAALRALAMEAGDE